MVSEKLIDELSALPKSRLLDKEQLPIKMADRHMTPFKFFLMWMGMSVLLAVFTNAANMYPSLSMLQVLAAVAVGNLITVVTLAINGDLGITYGINFPVYLRAIFGYTGTAVPSIVRAIPACYWYGFQTWLGAEAINLIIMKLFPSWPGTYPYLLGIIIVFMLIQTLTTAKGMDSITKFESLITPLMFCAVVYLLYFCLSHSGMSASEILMAPAAEAVEGKRYSFAYAVTAMTGFWATMALNIPDLTRFLKCNPDEPKWFKRNWCSIWPQVLGMIPMMCFLAFIGAAAMFTSGQWDPIQYIAAMDSPVWLLIMILLLSVFAQWTSNIGANILPPAVIFSTVFKNIDFKKGCYVATILAFAMQPWKIADKVVTANLVVGIMLGGIAGMMMADYYLLRRRKLNVKDLYVEGGEYEYAKGWNPVAFVCYIIATIAGLMFSDLGFLTALVVGAVSYYLIMRFWGAKKYNQTSILCHFKK